MAVTPGGRPGDATPLGHKGGKRRLTDYEREVAHALMRRGKSKRDAIRIARGVIAKAAATGVWGRKGKAKPNVRAGAVASIAQSVAIGARKGGAGRRRDLSVPVHSSGDGPRVTIPAMAAKRKTRAGSIPSGKGKGKFPITDQKSVKSAAALLSKAKGVSRQAVIAHVRAEAKKRGLKLTPVFDLSVPDVDLAKPGQRFRHGWIPIGGGYKVNVHERKLGAPETYHPVHGPNGEKVGTVITAHRVRTYHYAGRDDRLGHRSIKDAAKAIKKTHKSGGGKRTQPVNLSVVDGQVREVFTLDLVGPKGYSHGWIKAGVPTHIVPRGSAGGKSRTRVTKLPSTPRTKGSVIERSSTPQLRERATRNSLSPAHRAAVGRELQRREQRKDFIPNAQTPAAKEINRQAAAHDQRARVEKGTKGLHHVVSGPSDNPKFHGSNRSAKGAQEFADQINAEHASSSAVKAAPKPVRSISTSIGSNQMRKLGHSAQKKTPARYTHNGQLVQSSSLDTGFKVSKHPDGGIEIRHRARNADQQATHDAGIKQHFEGLGYTVDHKRPGQLHVHDTPAPPPHPGPTGPRTIIRTDGLSAVEARRKINAALLQPNPPEVGQSRLIANAVTMHGSDRSKWSVTNLQAAAKLGDPQAISELNKRKGNR